MIQQGKIHIPKDFGSYCCSLDHMQCPSFAVLEASVGSYCFVAVGGLAAFGVVPAFVLSGALWAASGIQ